MLTGMLCAYCRYNAQVFEGRLPRDLDISWNSKLTTTAGLTQYQRSIQTGTTEYL